MEDEENDDKDGGKKMRMQYFFPHFQVFQSIFLLLSFSLLLSSFLLSLLLPLLSFPVCGKDEDGGKT